MLSYRKNIPAKWWPIFIAVVLTACSQNQKDNQKQPKQNPPIVKGQEFKTFIPQLGAESKFKDYEYLNMAAVTWLSTDVYYKVTGKRVAWFQVFDQRHKPHILKGYQNTEHKINGYPARVFPNKWVWILVNNIEIRLIADQKTKHWQNTQKLTEFIKAFDLQGLAKL